MMKGTEHDEALEREDALEALFSHATMREQPPAEAEEAIRNELHGQWRDLTERRRRRKRNVALGAVASAALALLVSGFLYRQPAGPEAGIEAATAERVIGRVSLHGEDGRAAADVQPGMDLKTAQVLTTAHGAGLALRWHNGIALRLDQNSRVVFTSPGAIELAAGRIYVDTSDVAAAGAELVLTTPAGPVRHVGTRYMVAVNFGSTQVSVREGRVLLGVDATGASAGEKLIVNASGERRREAVAVYGDDWQWAEALTEPVSPDGKRVSELLAWVGRETGRAVAYASPGAERLAAETQLHGEVGMEPMQVLELITKSTDLVTEFRGGTIVVDAPVPP